MMTIRIIPNPLNKLLVTKYRTGVIIVLHPVLIAEYLHPEISIIPIYLNKTRFLVDTAVLNVE